MVMTLNISSVDDAYLIADKTGPVHQVIDKFPNSLFMSVGEPDLGTPYIFKPLNSRRFVKLSVPFSRLKIPFRNCENM